MKSSFFFILLAVTRCLTENLSDEWKSQLHHDLESYNKTGEKPPNLTNFLTGLVLPQLLTKWHASEDKTPLCELCDVMVDIAIDARKLKIRDDIVAEIFVKICKWLQLDREDFCETYVKHNIDIWLYAIDNKPTIRSKSFCLYALQRYHCQDPQRVDWTVKIPPRPNSYNQGVSQTVTSGPPLKILHLTDIHYDPDYEPGSDANCNSMLCCQKGSQPRNSTDQAGYWGSYPCDSPWHAVEDVLNRVVEKHDTFDAIYFTGDIIKHNEWLTSVSGNTDDILKVFNKFKEVFKGLPVYPILGNHEPHPAHQFAADGINANSGLSTQWLYDLVGKSWNTWLPEESLQTVLKGGYYTVLVKPGLRLIALNSNVCFTYNHWLFFNDEDPLGQLQWMVDILEQAEKDGERVHIISHVPSNDEFCFFNWGKEYARIVERFAHIIAGQFNGHTHDEDIIVYFNSQNRSEALNIAFVGGSTTTFTYLNPNYKIFDVDPTTFNVLNYETWVYNLTEANLTPNDPPRWYKLYDFKTAYSVSSLDPNDVADLVGRMTKESGLLQEYYRFKKREADPAVATGCNRKCELANLCYVVTSSYGDDINCKHYTEIYNNNNPSL